VSRKGLERGVELLRKGAVLLKEPCPKCGGLQVLYKGRKICLNCGELGEAISSPSEVLSDLRSMLIDKIKSASDRLGSESDLKKQAELTDLLLKYVELLEKVGKALKG